MNCWHRPPKFLKMSCKKKGLHRVCLFVFHSHDLTSECTRTYFPGMYWVLPWECSRPRSSDLPSTDGLTVCIGQDRDSHQLGTLSTILQHFTHTRKLMVADVTLRCGMYPAFKVDISRHLAIPGSLNRHSFDQKYKIFYFENNSAILRQRRQK